MRCATLDYNLTANSLRNELGSSATHLSTEALAMIYMLRALCIVLQVFNRDYNVDLTVASKAAYMNEYTRRTPPTAKLDFASLVNDPSFWSSALYLMVMACLNHLRSKHLLAGEHTAPENRPSQKESNLLTINFQVFFLFVSGRVIS